MQKVLLFTILTLVLAITAFKPDLASERVNKGINSRPLTGLEDVINALRSGNAQELSKYVDDNIEINLPDKDDTYSRAQAIMVLRDFFTNAGVKGFEVQFRGENSGNQYCIGKMLTRSGNFRTTVFMKTKEGKQLVKEIRFQPM